MTHRTIPELLAELGELTPGQIADKMIAEGYKGKCAGAFECVIANYLREESGTARVGVDTIYTSWRGAPTGEWEGEVPTPWEVARFVANFDDHVYPELVA